MPRGQLSKGTLLQIQVTKLKKGILKLRSLVHDLQHTIKVQEKEIGVLKAKLEDKEAQRKQLLTYLYKPNHFSTDHKPRGKKRGAQAFHRPKPKDEEVTETSSFPLHTCPVCKHTLGEPAEIITRYEEDIDLVPSIRKFIINRYWCSFCKDIVKSPHIPAIHRIGLHVLGYILYARYRLRLPLEKIKESLFDLHNFRISEGEIAEKLQEAEELFGKDYQGIIELIQQATVVHADETGWRMEGENWWLWVFTTPKGATHYVLDVSRGGGVAQQALGTKQNRVIISDGYAVYAKLTGDKQQCWVHLLRVAKNASQQLYGDLATLYIELGTALTKSIKDRDPPYFETRLTEIKNRSYQEIPAQKVQERITRHFSQLLTCLYYEGVLPENNTAERSLRPQVVMRKIFGGSRSVNGARAHEVNTSVLETLRNQHPNTSFFEVVLPLLKQRLEERHSGL